MWLVRDRAQNTIFPTPSPVFFDHCFFFFFSPLPTQRCSPVLRKDGARTTEKSSFWGNPTRVRTSWTDELEKTSLFVDPKLGVYGIDPRTLISGSCITSGKTSMQLEWAIAVCMRLQLMIVVGTAFSLFPLRSISSSSSSFAILLKKRKSKGGQVTK